MSPEGLFQAADELLGLINQVQDRLTTRQEARTTAESFLEASGAALRVQPRVQAPSGLLGALQAAIAARRPIRFRYYLRRERKYRTYRVDPLGIIFHRFAYLVCINHKAKRGGPRTFRISEIDRVEELPGQFLPPKNFQLNEFVQQSFGVYHGGELLDVVWRFKPSVADEAQKFQFHPNQTLEKEKDGSLVVKFSAKGDVEMCWELFTWGSDVEIVSPQSLKDTYCELVDDLSDAAENLVS
jgi:predicted DNA-binding transcriptional regulator YafY